MNKEKLEYILRHRGMYGIEADLGRAISFVAGFDAASDGLVLNGFRDWFISSFMGNSSEPFSWLILVEQEVKRIEENEVKRVSVFVDIVVEYLNRKKF